MKLKDGRITVLFDRDDGLKIELYDHESNITFAKIVLDPKQVVTAFSRLGYVECSIELSNLDYVNKKMEYKKIEFKLPKFATWDQIKIVAEKEAIKVCPKGWKPDLYFGSKDSFFFKTNRNDKQENWARCIIRRWVPIEKGE